MHMVQIPDHLEKRLNHLCKEIRHTPKYCVKKALEAWIEDREDYLLAVQAHEEFVKSGSKGIPWEEVQRKAGLLEDE